MVRDAQHRTNRACDRPDHRSHRLRAKRLPELGKSLGRGIREFKGSVSGDHDDDDEPKPPAEIESSKAPAEKAAEDEPVAHDRG